MQDIQISRPLPPFDVQAPLLSLPGILGTTLANVPAHVPYLHAQPKLMEQWRNELRPLAGFKGRAGQGRRAKQRVGLRAPAHLLLIDIEQPARRLHRIDAFMRLGGVGGTSQYFAPVSGFTP